MASNLLSVRITSPKEDVFVGQALAVSSVNSVGSFDILPEHAKFITMVEKQPLILRLSDKTKKEFNFTLAIIHVRDNKVDIYIEPQEIGQDLTGVV